MMININKESEKSLTVENANVKLFFQTQYNSVQDKGLPFYKQLHTHSYVEVFACISGELVINTAGNEYILNNNDIAIVPIEVEHFKSPESDYTKWAKIGLVCSRFQGEYQHDIYSHLSDLISYDRVTIYKKQPRLCEYIKVCCDKKSDSEISSVLVFLSEFIKLPKIHKDSKSLNDKNKCKAKNIDRLLKLDDIINTNYDKGFSNKEIARLLNISQRQLSRIVAENYSLSLRKMILKKQLDIVAELLVTTNNNIEDIAFSVGFKNSNSFHREFKKRFEQTPIAYRKSKTK